MSLREVLSRIAEGFKYPVPEDYLSFLKAGDFESTLRMYYVTDDENAVEISEWFTGGNISEIYRNCRKEKMIEEYYLPILDSCGCTVILNCNSKSDSYGQVLLITPDGYYDENLGENVYPEPDFVADSFSEIINNLKSEDELEEMGIF